MFLPERRVEEPLLDGIRLSSTLALPLRGAFSAIVDHRQAGPAVAATGEPQLVRPGSLGSWADDDEGHGDGAALG